MSASEGALQFSFDRGESWTNFVPVNPGLLIYTWDIAVDIFNPDIMYYATGKPAWDTPDEQGLYTVDLTTIDPVAEFNDGPGDLIPSTAGTGIWRVYPLENGTFYLATQNYGVLKSEDACDTWAPMSNGLDNLSVTSIVFDESFEPMVATTRGSDGDPRYAYMLWDPSGEEGAVYKWDPVLESWSRKAETQITSAVYSVVNVPDDPERIYATCMQGVFLSTDGGETWEAKDWGLPQPDGYFQASDIVIHPEDPNRLFVDSWLFGVYASSDGGEHWTAFNQNLNQYYMQELIIDWEFPNIVYSSTVGNSIMKCITGNPPVVDSVTGNSVPLSEPYEVTIKEETLLEVQIEGHDPDGDTLTYSAYLNLAEVPAPWEVPDPDEEFTFDPETHVFRWIPWLGSSENGPWELVLKISDDAMAAYADVEIIIDPIHPPELDWITADGVPLSEPYGASVVEEEFIEVQIEATDADGDTLTYSASFLGEDLPAPWEVPDPDEVATFDPDTHIFRWAPPYGASTSSPYQLYFEVTDGRFTIIPSVEISVEPIHPPEVDWITADGVPLSEPYGASVVEEAFIEVQIEATDADGDTLTYSASFLGEDLPAPWEVPDPDEVATFDPDTHIFRWAPPYGYSASSPYQLNFEVTDGRFTIYPTVEISVEPIHPPEVDWITADGVPLSEPYGASVVEEEFIEVQIEATDADGDTLTYSAVFLEEQVPAPWEVPDPDEVATFDPDTHIFRWAPPYGYSPWGPFPLSFEVTDGRFTINPSVVITVEPIHPPEVDWVTANGVPLSEPYEATVDEETFIEVQIEAFDADGDTLTYSAVFNGEDVPAPWEVPDPDEVATFDPDTHIFRWSPPYGYSPWSPFQLYLQVTDGRFTIYAPVEIIVEPIHPPEVDWITADGIPLSEPYEASVMEDEFIEVQIEVTDVDGDTLTYSALLNGMDVPAPWEVPNPDETFTFDPDTHIFRWAPPIGSTPGNPHSLQFTVTDGLFYIYPSVEITAEPALPMEFMLEMDAAYTEGIMILDFTIATPEPAYWFAYLVLTFPTTQYIQLWAAQTQIIYPPAEMPIVFTLASSGTVGIWSALYTGEGIQTVAFEWVDTKGQ